MNRKCGVALLQNNWRNSIREGWRNIYTLFLPDYLKLIFTRIRIMYTDIDQEWGERIFLLVRNSISRVDPCVDT